MKMMKPLSPVLALILVAAALCACGAPAPAGYDKTELVLSEYNGAEISPNIQIGIDGSVAGQEETTLTYTNLTDRAFTFTALQRLEVQLDGEWYIVPDAQNFVTMQIFTLPGNYSVDDNFRVEGRYEALPQGSFRIVKSFVDYDGNIEIAAAEFSVK